eukprot:7466456-Heterocapsa_arctica.AAC.1
MQTFKTKRVFKELVYNLYFGGSKGASNVGWGQGLEYQSNATGIPLAYIQHANRAPLANP